MYGVIYKITNQINGKSYVGKTTTSLKQRMASHKCADSVIGKAIRKYGAKNFTCVVIAVTSGENNPFFGKHHTEESLAKMSEAHRGNTAWVGWHHRKETKAKISAWRRIDTPFKNLLAEMDKRHTSYKDLAELLGLARTTLPEKMRGKKNFTKEQVAKREEIFGLPAEYLLKRD